MTNLSALQAAFYRHVTSPGSEPGPNALVNGIATPPSGSPELRLDVYRNAYFTRLIGALEEDFPCVLAHVGHDAFHDLAHAYLSRFPPTSPSLRELGERWPSFLIEHPLATRTPWLGELAWLEWARIDVFDAPNVAPMAAEELASVPPEAWPSLSFAWAPWARVFETRYPIHEAWKPLDAGHEAPVLSASRTHLVVWRREFVVMHRATTPEEGEALMRLAAGRPFAEICEAYAHGQDTEQAATAAARALSQWLVDGLLASRAPAPSDVSPRCAAT